MRQGTIIPASHVPDWAEDTEASLATVGDRNRVVVDHYGTAARIRLPGLPTKYNHLDEPDLTVQVSRADLVDEGNETRMVVGPYRIGISVGEQYDADIADVAELEAFAARILEATQQVRDLVDREQATVATGDISDRD